MSTAFDLASFLIDFINGLRTGDIEWRQKKLEEIAELKKQKKIYDIQIEHEINLIRIKFTEEINRAKEKENRITKDYKEFLDSIDEMKQKVLGTFSDMPKPMAHIIHHHARQLLDNMWNNPDERVKQLCKAKLTNLLEVIYDDTAQALTGQGKFPSKTLQLIRGEEK